ncbi:uncharacterized protein LOC122504725 [Leptopilina heterotoma]|uniref:uncharacterized protein LOC122504725 n=1 Tax=Leptopilina heterotoma TaxID=63436 RepID=UPI001CA9E195|nr:uncharacterized protein LOC122504725 [Leptopilina heterotoma]
MKVSIFSGVLVLILFYFSEIRGHGMLMQPVNRASAWRKGFRTPINYDDNANYCGGFNVQYAANKGKCGVCGDNYATKQPRPNENNGHYGKGVIVQRYKAGEKIDLTVQITANHIGYFKFAICPLKNADDIETEACFKKYPITLMNNKDRYTVPARLVGLIKIKAYLPENLTCERCVLRWHYRAGNNWGVCPNGRGQLGCGNQETFRTCSDIAIDP